MTTATSGGTENDDDVVTMDMEPVEDEPKKKGLLPPGTARIVFIALAAIAVIAVLVAIFAIWRAPANAVALLIVSLVVLAVVVLAEVVLLIVARPREA